MGKRKDDSFESETVGDPQHKKHKKHKKHKHKKRHPVEDSDEDVLQDQASPPPIKLKIKIGGQTLESTSVPSVGEVSETLLTSSKEEIKWQEVKSDVFKTKKPGEDTSDEEQQWLDALEKGELDDTGGVKKDRDPLLMTARQRALLHGKPEESLLELPSGYKPPGGEGGQLTEEQITRRQQKAKKRKEQAQQKAEKDKKQTLDRLLKKQESKVKGGSGKPGRSRKTQTPGFRYLNKGNSITISVPQGCHFPFVAQTEKQPQPAELCSVAGCCNTKKYSCSKTGVPLCSLECYKTNMAARQRAG